MHHASTVLGVLFRPIENSDAVASGHDIEMSSRHRASLATGGDPRRCQLTTTLKFRVFPEPQDANRNMCLLQYGDGVDAAEETRSACVSSVLKILYYALNLLPSHLIPFVIRRVTYCVC